VTPLPALKNLRTSKGFLSPSRSSIPKVKFADLEVSDLVCKVQNGLKLPIDEDPKHMKNYMHTRMASQAN
jgi:hypothetical protein